MNDQISIAMVDDHNLFRTAMKSSLEKTGKYQVIISASSGREILTKLSKSPEKPSIILLDIFMEEMDGFETMEFLARDYPGIHVIALSMEDEVESVARMIKAGAVGYLLKACSMKELENALEQVLENGFYYNSLSNKAIRNQLRHKEKPLKSRVKLTDREQEYLDLACSDLTYKEIGKIMNVSVRTIDSYRDNLFEKFGVKSRVGLMVYAIKNHLVDMH
jgi:two-component system invasion response regulator UvrY